MFSNCTDLQAKRAREAAKGVINEGLEAGELAGTSGRAGDDDDEEDDSKV